MRTLVLLRHGKSGYPDGVADHDRPLAARGQREAAVAGNMLGDRISSFDVALVSTARRAQDTWSVVAPALATHRVEDRADLYLADVEELLDVVRSLSTEVSVALLVGHNEGLEELASGLTGVPVTLKTSTFAVLRSAGEWNHWARGSATLSEVVVAR